MRLNCAAHDGDLYRLSRLIGAGAEPNRTDYDGRSPLHLAASKGHGDITVFLVQRGVDINARDNFGYPPLLEAVKNGHDHVASLLVETGALLGIDNDGTCLCEAAAKRDLEHLKRLLANGINPNSKNYDLRTTLHLSASEGLFPISVLLLEAGASVFAVDRWGKSPVDEARVGGNKNLIKLLEDAKGSQCQNFLQSLVEVKMKDSELDAKCSLRNLGISKTREEEDSFYGYLTALMSSLTQQSKGTVKSFIGKLRSVRRWSQDPGHKHDL